MFQFQFENPEDLEAVLDNRPYHFAKWMVIIQKWEPTISPEFPSQIPFWVQVQGVLVPLWSESLLRGVGEDIGTFVTWEITAALVYEKLEKHCNSCFRLDHEWDECPQNQWC